MRLHPSLKSEIGTCEVRVQISDYETIDTLIMKIGRRHPKFVEMIIDPATGDLRKDLEILLNGRRIKDIHTKLKHKDEISVNPIQT